MGFSRGQAPLIPHTFYAHASYAPPIPRTSYAHTSYATLIPSCFLCTIGPAVLVIFENLTRHSSRDYTEVQGISIVGYTGVEGGRTRSWNLQYLCPVPPYVSGHDNPGTPYFSFFLKLWQIFGSSPAAYCRRAISGPRFPFFYSSLHSPHPSSSYWYWCSLKSKVYPRLLLCTNIATGSYIRGKIFDFGEYHTRIMLCKYDSSNIVCRADSDKKK